MEQMTQELNIDNYDLKSIKKLYNTSMDNNMFLNSYTLLDVESGKKKTFTYLMKKYNYRQPQYIQSFVDSTAMLLAKEIFASTPLEHINVNTNTPSSVVQNLKPKNVQEIHRMITIDSAYRSNLFSTNNIYNSYTSSDMIIQLNDNLDSTSTLELTSVCIPFTFYNINSDHGTNFFYVKNDTGVTKIEISDGNYDVSTAVDAINSSLTSNSMSLQFQLDGLTNKVSVSATTTTSYEIIFYDNSNNSDYSFNPQNKSSSYIGPEVQTKLNNSLGWLLGFRNADLSNYDKLAYDVTSSVDAVAEALCHIPYTKYFIIVIDDMNRNQSNKGLVQIKNDKEQIERKKYFKNIDNSLNCLTDENFDSYANPSTTNNSYTASLGAQNGLTKNQLYSALQVNNYRATYSENTSKLTANLINDVFAIIPFETKSLVWGKSMFTSDKNKFKRKYVGPVNISKMNVKLLDDRGNLMNLNGAEWSFSMISTHVQKN
jgi:hypothetical protein